MKFLLKILGFRNLDEMEQSIAFMAQRNALLFLLAALLVWALYEARKVFVLHQMMNPLPCILLLGAICIQIFSQLIMTRNAVKDDEDSFETLPLLRIILMVCIVAGAVAAVAAAILLLGTKL